MTTDSQGRLLQPCNSFHASLPKLGLEVLVFQIIFIHAAAVQHWPQSNWPKVAWILTVSSCCLGPAKLGHDFKDQKRPTKAPLPLPYHLGSLVLAALDSGALPGSGAALSLVGFSPGPLSLADPVGQQKLAPLHQARAGHYGPQVWHRNTDTQAVQIYISWR